MEELKPWDTVHVDLIGPYSVLMKQQLPDGRIRQKEVKLTCMTMIDPATGCIVSLNVDESNSGRISLWTRHDIQYE